jgi:hypothetical protein
VEKYAKYLWAHTLRDQLQVSEFWNCARDEVKPDRGMPEPPAEALPADLVHLLITRVGLSESEVGAMSKASAVERLSRYWTEVHERCRPARGFRCTKLPSEGSSRCRCRIEELAS